MQAVKGWAVLTGAKHLRGRELAELRADLGLGGPQMLGYKDRVARAVCLHTWTSSLTPACCTYTLS